MQNDFRPNDETATRPDFDHDSGTNNGTSHHDHRIELLQYWHDGLNTDFKKQQQQQQHAHGHSNDIGGNTHYEYYTVCVANV